MENISMLMAIFMREIGIKIKQMDMAPISAEMDRNILGYEKMIYSMDKVRK